MMIFRPNLLLRGGVCLVLALAANDMLASNTQFSVDAGKIVRIVEDRHFGLNTAVWDSNLNSPKTISLLQDIGTRTLRFPGGSTSDTYHWKTNTSDGNTWQWSTGFDAFTNIIKGTNARVFITVNYGSGTVQEAADWVDYANNQKGLGLKYWEVGNECYGSWENDIQAVKNDPYTYATRFADFYKKMKAVDPTIRVGAVVTTGEDSYNNTNNTPRTAVTNPRTGASHKGWTPILLATLKGLGVAPDYVIYHRYEQQPGAESDTLLLQSAKTWPNDAADLRQQLNDYLGTQAAAGVEMVVTENNSASYNPGKQMTSLVNALFYADSIGNLLQTEFNGFVWWDLRNGPLDTDNNSPTLYGWRNYGDYGITEPTNGNYPAYYAVKIVSKFARTNDAVVQATSDNSLLSCYAVRKTDGSVNLLVVNKSPSAAQTATVSLSNFSPAATATTYAYGIPQDNAARDGTGNTDLATGTMNIPGATFTASFDPYSITVICMPPSATTSQDARLSAISCRAVVGTGGDVLIPGIIIGGTGSKQVLVRASGPALISQGVSGTLAQPQLSLYSGSTVIAQNIGWSSGTAANTSALQAAFTQVGLSQFPNGSADCALLATLAPGLYTAIISGVNNSTGVALVEVYELGTSSSNLSAISCRAVVGTGGNVLIPGIIVSGTGQKKVLVRASGPALIPLGVTGTLAQPQLSLYGGSTVIAQNTGWSSGSAADTSALQAAVTQTGLTPFPTGSADCALLATLSPGAYTAIISGVNNTTGVALIEVYEVP
jgi:hypothetical protein